MFSYALTIGTIDSGITSKIHDYNAVVFFVTFFFSGNKGNLNLL